MPAASRFILYVADQRRSTAFYSAVLGISPRLDVPGMTEFNLPGGAVLGLMPAAGIHALLGAALAQANAAPGTPKAELYLVVPQASSYHARALMAGARELSPMLARGWGHIAGYSQDQDGYVLAFANLPS